MTVEHSSIRISGRPCADEIAAVLAVLTAGKVRPDVTRPGPAGPGADQRGWGPSGLWRQERRRALRRVTRRSQHTT